MKKIMVTLIFIVSVAFTAAGIADQKVQVREVVLKKIQEDGIKPGLAFPETVSGLNFILNMPLS